MKSQASGDSDEKKKLLATRKMFPSSTQRDNYFPEVSGGTMSLTN